MRTVLVGVPDTGKYDFAMSLYNKNGTPIGLDPEELLEELYGASERLPAIGLMADYRTELLLASFRAHEMIINDNATFRNSLLDSLAYATTIISMNLENQIIAEQWFNCYSIFTSLFQDSFKYDKVYRFPYTGDIEQFKVLDNNLKFFLELYNIDYINKRKGTDT